jgi:Undecaprenyl-phosphate glucose phosphotransferase
MRHFFPNTALRQPSLGDVQGVWPTGRTTAARRSRPRWALSRRVPGAVADIVATGLEVLGLLAAAWWAATSLYGAIAPPLAEALIRSTLVITMLHVVVVHGLGGLGPEDRFSYTAAIRSAIIWSSVIMFVAIIGFLVRASIDVPSRWAMQFAMLGGIAVPVMRFAGVALARWTRGQGAFDLRSAVVGTTASTRQITEHLEKHPWLTVSICGQYADLDTTRSGLDDHAGAGGMSELIAAIRRGQLDQVIVILSEVAPERIATVLDLLAQTPVRVRLVSRLDPAPRSRTVFLGNLPLETVADPPLTGLAAATKSVADRAVACGLLVILAPLLLGIAAAIWIETRGPVFFRQDREGYNCRSFRIWKFRSMHVRACNHTTLEQARRGDPRVTRVGAFLRRWSLDELPQLVNVVLGEMSIVGPRPHAASTRAGGVRFGEVTHDYHARHRVKPGITGWAQVCGLRGETDTCEKLIRRLEHDLYYCERWSLGFDVRILFLTIVTVPFQRGV